MKRFLFTCALVVVGLVASANQASAQYYPGGVSLNFGRGVGIGVYGPPPPVYVAPPPPPYYPGPVYGAPVYAPGPVVVYRGGYGGYGGYNPYHHHHGYRHW